MTRTRLSLATLASLVVLVAAGCGSGSKSSGSNGSNGLPSDAVATVAGKSITRSELDDLMKSAEPQYKQRTGQNFPEARDRRIPGASTAGSGVPRDAGGVHSRKLLRSASP